MSSSSFSERLKIPYTKSHAFRSRVLGATTSYFELSYGPKDSTDVILWLHGSGPRPVDQLAIAAQSYLKSAIQRNHHRRGLRVIMPFCPPDAFWLNVDNRNRRIEDHVIYELIPECMSRFTKGSDAKLQIHGYSMGAYGALRIGLKHSDLFGRILAIAAGPLSENFLDAQRGDKGVQQAIYRNVFHGSDDVYKRLSPYSIASNMLDSVIANSQMIDLVVGVQDPCCPDNQKFFNKINALGIDVSLHLIDGIGHRLDHYMERLVAKLLVCL